MLLGKLSVPATKTFQTGPFETSVATAEYIAVKAHNYVIGGDSVKFDIRVGNIVIENEKERFDPLIREVTEIPLSDLSTWLSDDSVVLDIIATKFNMVLTEKIQKDFHFTF
jgi:hypothetical protein